MKNHKSVKNKKVSGDKIADASLTDQGAAAEGAWPLLTDLYGESPKVAFATVEDGFKKMFNRYIRHTESWFGSVDKSYDTSPLWNSLPVLREYVCLQQYQIQDPSYNVHPGDQDDYICMEPLWDQVMDLYNFWDTSLHIALWSYEDLTLEERYFSLFAQAAFLRARLDLNLFGPHTPQDVSSYEGNYFSDGEISLLAGTTPKALGEKVRILREATEDSPKQYVMFLKDSFSKEDKLSAIHYPLDEYPELRYYSNNATRQHRESGWSETNAIYVLENLYDYKMTGFINAD